MGRRDGIMYRVARKAMEEHDAANPLDDGECENCAATNVNLYRVRALDTLMNAFENKVSTFVLDREADGTHYLDDDLKQEWVEFSLMDDNCTILCRDCRLDYRKARRQVLKEGGVVSEMEMTRLAYEAGFTRTDLMSIGLHLFNYTRAIEKFHGIKEST